MTKKQQLEFAKGRIRHYKKRLKFFEDINSEESILKDLRKQVAKAEQYYEELRKKGF